MYRMEHNVLAEIYNARRVLYHGKRAIARIPFCARYPYKVGDAAGACGEFCRLSAAQRANLARALKTVQLKHEG